MRAHRTADDARFASCGEDKVRHLLPSLAAAHAPCLHRCELCTLHLQGVFYWDVMEGRVLRKFYGHLQV